MRKFRSIRFLGALTVISFIFVFGTPLFSQTGGEGIIIGKTVIFKSKILNRDVNLQVRLPRGYAAGDSSYPVLYDLNAFFCFAYDSGTVELLSSTSDIPDMIVVGLPPLQNGYVPTAYESRGESPAGADLSIRFLGEELIPYVEKNYRSNMFRILYGHSVGGLFTMYTLFTHPELFTAYIAGSPWFQVNDQYWLKNIDKMVSKSDLSDTFLFMTVGKEEDPLTIDTYKKLEKWMNHRTFTGLTWKSAWVEGDHGSMVGRNIYDGLAVIFEGWKTPNSLLVSADVEGIDRQIKASTAKWGKYGLDLSAVMPEQRLNGIGYALINRQEIDKAIKIFEYNLKLYPKSYNTHDSLAEGYLIKGDKERAIKFYKLALELNPGDTERAKQVLKNSKDKLRELGVEN